MTAEQRKAINKAIRKATSFFLKFGYMDFTRFRMFFDNVDFENREQEITLTQSAYLKLANNLYKAGHIKTMHAAD